MLLEAKLHVPRRRRGIVARPRLHRGLELDALPPVVLVSAPAGFGKTTLVTEWLHDLPARAWVSLDRRDRDPAVFWTYVIAALERVEPGIGTDALATLHATPDALDPVVATLANALARLDHDVVLVLDDYHVVESLRVHESMLLLLEHLPAPLHLVVTSRADPPWPLAGLRARGDLLEVRAADLRFTTDEATAYLNDAMGLGLTAAEIDTLEGRTEGWIAALQLAALSMRDRDDPAAFIAGFAGDDRFVVDYLVDEVLDRQPDDVRRFLLDTSILSRLSAGSCGAVTGRADAKATLDALDRSNLFLVALDDRRSWFRYHHLFGDVLRARLADERPADDVADLHRRAAGWFERAGDRAEAIRHAMAAEDHAKAAELIELSVPELRQARQEATLRSWFDALPEHVFADRPVLTLGLVGSHMAVGDVTGIAELLDDIAACLASGKTIVHDQAELRRLPAQIAMYRAGLALLRGDVHATIEQGRHAAELSAADDHLGRGAAAALVGLAQWTTGALAPATDQYATAIAEFRAARHHADILGCSLGLADMQVAQGRLGAAERTLRAGLALAATHGPLRGTADMHVAFAEIHLERNELDLAAEQLRAGLAVGEHLALGQHAHRRRVVEARLRLVHGDHGRAIELLRDAQRCYDTDYSPKVRPVAATLARAHLLAGDVALAQQWAADAGVSPGDEVAYLHEYEHLTLARVLLATGQVEAAEQLLDRLLAAADAGERAGSAAEAAMLLALAHHTGGRTTRALAAITDALTRAEPERFVRMFLDAGAPMVAVLRAAVAHGRAVAPASAILAHASTVSSMRPGLVDPLSARELDVLRLLRSDLTGPQIAAELVVSLNTVRTHTKAIFAKLGVSSRRAAVRRADELGL